MKVCRLSAIVWLFNTFTMAQRFRAMDILPEQTLAPRYYQAASPLRVLGRRQIAACEGGQHPCGDIGALGTGFCCPDDTYCIVDPLTANKPACCAIGSVCGSSCSESQYQCIGTTTITSVTPASTSTFPACCPRQCITTSQFGCPSSLGGGCCSYGQTCASNSQCLWTSTTSTAITLVSQLPPGCTTSQIACPSSMGGGCCAVTQSCTFASGSPACVAITTTPTASGISPAPQDTSLGTAAKAGIAIGVILATSLLIGLLTYICLRRRRRLASQIPPFTPSQLASPYSRTPTNGTEPTSPIRRPRRTAFGLRSPTRGPEMNETNSDVVSHGGRLRGLTVDYFGPDAVPGPFTETDTLAGSGVADSPGGRNPDRAVPMSPLSPDDITAPVEIDSRKRQISETIKGRHELYGSGGGRDPVSPYTPSPGTGGIPFSPVGTGTGTYSPGTEVPPYSPGTGTMDSTMSYVPGTDTLQYSPMRQEKDR